MVGVGGELQTASKEMCGKREKFSGEKSFSFELKRYRLNYLAADSVEKWVEEKSLRR